MGTFDWKSLVKTVAPQLASMLGTPLAGMAVSAIANALLPGKPGATEADVAVALQNATPADLIKLKELQDEMVKTLSDAGVKLAETDAADRASARDREEKLKDWTPRILATVIILGWFATQWAIFHFHVEDSLKDLLTSADSKLDDALMLVLYYYFGSSSGSREKDKTIGKIAEAP